MIEFLLSNVVAIVFQLLSRVWLFATPWTAACQASPSITISEFAQTDVHWVCDAIQPSHPFLPSSPFALNFSQHHGLFQWELFTSSSQSIAAPASPSVLPVNIQDWFPLGWTGLISLLSKGLSRVFSTTRVQKHQFFSTQPSLWFNSHFQTWLLKNHSFDYMTFVGKVMSLPFKTLSRFDIAILPRSKHLFNTSYYKVIVVRQGSINKGKSR